MARCLLPRMAMKDNFIDRLPMGRKDLLISSSALVRVIPMALEINSIDRDHAIPEAQVISIIVAHQVDLREAMTNITGVVPGEAGMMATIMTGGDMVIKTGTTANGITGRKDLHAMAIGPRAVMAANIARREMMANGGQESILEVKANIVPIETAGKKDNCRM